MISGVRDKVMENGKAEQAMAAWFWYFVIYSFLGFLLEVVFARVTRQPKRDRKCFYLLPLCPVYGLGALAILALPGWVKADPFLLVLAGGAAATAVEYLVGLWDEKVLGVRFWNYEGVRGNVGGKVCLPFAAAWGVLSLGLVKLVHPWVALWVGAIPAWLTPAAAVLVAGDWAHSALLLRRAGTTDVLKWYS